MFNPYLPRQALAAILFICGAVVLGISIHVEHALRLVFGVSTTQFTFDAFVGAWTILSEVVMAAMRLINPASKANSLLVELAVVSINFIFWIAAGISTTLYTEADRSACKHLDDLFDLPEFENVDQQTLTLLKNAFQDACSELHAELAFIWIAFIAVVAAGGVIMMQVIHRRKDHEGGIMSRPLRDTATIHEDPFADPDGRHGGRSVGIGHA